MKNHQLLCSNLTVHQLVIKPYTKQESMGNYLQDLQGTNNHRCSSPLYMRVYLHVSYAHLPMYSNSSLHKISNAIQALCEQQLYFTVQGTGKKIKISMHNLYRQVFSQIIFIKLFNDILFWHFKNEIKTHSLFQVFMSET